LLVQTKHPPREMSEVNAVHLLAGFEVDQFDVGGKGKRIA